MMQLSFENIFKIGLEHGLNEADFEAKASLIKEYLEKIEQRKQGFYKCIDDQNLVDSVNKYTESIKGKFERIVVLGIGGSSLGTIFLQQSLTSLFEAELPLRDFPKLYVLDNIDPVLMLELEPLLDYSKTLFIVVTKSGGTPETLAQYFYFRKKIEDKKLDPKGHFVFITDPEKGLLREIAREENIPSFEVPEDVGGRFSVLTAVGLLPAKLIGLDIEKLLSGAREMREKFLNSDFAQNLPFQLATIQYLLYKKGKIMNVLMPYSQKLIRFADWYRQLLAESIGKATNDLGDKVGIGITPINALGATDQHSQSQLYNEGPNDKLIIFVEVENLAQDIEIPEENLLDESVKFLKGVSFGQLFKTEMQGTMMALTENQRPNLTIKVSKIDEENLGELIMFFEAATAFLGEFFQINAFDQPGVELSKILTKKLLEKKN